MKTIHYTTDKDGNLKEETISSKTSNPFDTIHLLKNFTLKYGILIPNKI